MREKKHQIIGKNNRTELCDMLEVPITPEVSFQESSTLEHGTKITSPTSFNQSSIFGLDLDRHGTDQTAWESGYSTRSPAR